jgi:hypothetical protein
MKEILYISGEYNRVTLSLEDKYKDLVLQVGGWMQG